MKFLWIGLVLSIFMKDAVARIEMDVYKETPANLVKRYELLNNAPWRNDSIVLFKFLNGEYYGLIGIGSPAKTFKVVFDTTWAVSWLPSSHCAWTEIICKIHTQYDSSKSSSYTPNGTYVSITSPDLNLKGVLSTDTFHLPHVELVNQTFMEATHISFEPFWQYQADGIIGLAYQKLSLVPDYVPFFYNLVRQGLVYENVFTFYMNRDETTEKAGKVIFGGRQRTHVKNGTLLSLPVIDKKFWKVKVDKIYSVQNKTESQAFCENCEAIFDTSANSISGPPQAIENLNWLLNAQYIPGFNRYSVSCRQYAKLPDVYIVLNGHNFVIQSKYYVQHFVFQNIEACFSPFVPNTNPNQTYWELGGAFLMEFYTEFDMGNNVVNVAETIF